MRLGRRPLEQEPRSLCLIAVYFANLPGFTVLGCLLESARRWRLMGGKWGFPACLPQETGEFLVLRGPSCRCGLLGWRGHAGALSSELLPIHPGILAQCVVEEQVCKERRLPEPTFLTGDGRKNIQFTHSFCAIKPLLLPVANAQSSTPKRPQTHLNLDGCGGRKVPLPADATK